MTPAKLIAAGELVYGSQLRTPLAKALGVNRWVIHYYQSGERQIPKNIAVCIRRLAVLGPVGSLARAR